MKVLCENVIFGKLEINYRILNLHKPTFEIMKKAIWIGINFDFLYLKYVQ